MKKLLLFLAAICVCFSSSALDQDILEQTVQDIAQPKQEPEEVLYVGHWEEYDAQQDEKEQEEARELEKQELAMANDPAFKESQIIGKANWKQITDDRIVLFTYNNKVKSTACSGAMVGDYAVLTAAHCAIDKETGKFKNLAKNFLAYPGGKASGIGPVHFAKQVYISKDYVPENLAKDYAMVFLEKPIGKKTGYFNVEQPGIYSGLKIEVRHFPGSMPDKRNKNKRIYMPNDRPWLSKGEILNARLGDSLSISRHTADTLSGSSGAPIFEICPKNSKKNCEDTIIGINVAHPEVKTYNIATTPANHKLSKFVNDLWWADQPPFK